MCQEAVRSLCNPSESCHVRKVARLLARPLSPLCVPDITARFPTYGNHEPGNYVDPSPCSWSHTFRTYCYSCGCSELGSSPLANTVSRAQQRFRTLEDLLYIPL